MQAEELRLKARFDGFLLIAGRTKGGFMLRLLRVYRQAKWVWVCWYRYDLSDERFQRALIGLFELIPEKFKLKVHQDKYQKISS